MKIIQWGKSPVKLNHVNKINHVKKIIKMNHESFVKINHVNVNESCIMCKKLIQ